MYTEIALIEQIVFMDYLVYYLVVFISGVKCLSIYYQSSFQLLGYSLYSNPWDFYHAILRLVLAIY